MSSKVWSIGIQKHTKLIQHHVHIRSTDQFNQVGVHEKTRGPVGLYRSPGVQHFINKVLGFSHKRSSSMMENI